MAWTALTQSIQDLWLATRQPVGGSTSTLGTALVSDLVVGDFLPGARATVTATGSTVSGNRSLTLQRRGELTFTVSWPATASMWVARP